jgi:hypothetical protein
LVNVWVRIFQFVLRRPISALQFFGAFLIVLSICIAKIPGVLIGGGQSDVVNKLPMKAVLLAMLACVNSGETK